MANLLNQDAAFNYKGLLNLDSTINTPLDTTLRVITDGMGNASPLSLATNLIGVSSAVQYDWISTPAGTANKTTMWFDSTGRMSWRLGTGGSSYIRTFDATGIDADRVYTLPNATTTLAGLSVNQTFSAQQIFGAGTYTTGNSFFGNNTAIINSAGKAGFGVASGITATLTVQGDGTNPIAIFQNNTASSAIVINSNGLQIASNLAASSRVAFATGSLTLSGGWGGTAGFSVGIDNAVGGNFIGSVAGVTQGLLSISGTFASATASGNANFRPINISYTINNSAAQTGTATGIFLNATETNLNGQSHSLMDLQVGGASRFRVLNNGSVFAGTSFVAASGNDLGWNGRSTMYSPSNGNIVLSNSTYNGFGLLQFGGTTNLFPALKRNGAALEVKLADDSGFTGIQSLYYRFGTGTPEGNVTAPVGAIYSRTDGGANTTLYIKESGTGNTGWIAK